MVLYYVRFHSARVRGSISVQLTISKSFSLNCHIFWIPISETGGLTLDEFLNCFKTISFVAKIIILFTFTSKMGQPRPLFVYFRSFQ